MHGGIFLRTGGKIWLACEATKVGAWKLLKLCLPLLTSDPRRQQMQTVNWQKTEQIMAGSQLTALSNQREIWEDVVGYTCIMSFHMTWAFPLTTSLFPSPYSLLCLILPFLPLPLSVQLAQSGT